MLTYTSLSEEMKNLIKPYIKKGEDCKLSGDIELNGKLYREVIFSKRNLKSFKNEQQGYLYIGSDNSILSLKNVQKELAKLAQYFEVFFSEEKGVGILAALQTEGDTERERGHKEDICRGLDFLYEEGIADAARVKEVVKNLPELKEKSSMKIHELSSLVREIKDIKLVFTEELYQRLYPVYEDILKLNFEKVSLIGSITDCCDYVKVQAEKKRKKWKVRFKSNLVGPLLRVGDEISYFRRVIRTYEKVLNMNSSQYIKFLNNLNKEKIENRVSMIRM